MYCRTHTDTTASMFLCFIVLVVVCLLVCFILGVRLQGQRAYMRRRGDEQDLGI